MLTFQQIILTLQSYWDKQGCALLQPYDMEVGAGTFHTGTFLRAIGPEPWRAAYVQPSRRPKDGRYGENPNRLQHYYQYQVVLKPAPENILDLYLGSLEALGLDLKQNDVRFVEDDWESPTLGAWGLGWEVWLNGMEVTQFTYFQQVGGLDCKPVLGEITYGIERLAMYLQGVENVYDLVWTEWEENGANEDRCRTATSTTRTKSSSRPTISSTPTPSCCSPQFANHEAEAKRLVELALTLPAYEQIMKASHSFNMLDARGAISVTERAAYIGRVRTLVAPGRPGLLRLARKAGIPDGADAPRRKPPEPSATDKKRTMNQTLLVELLTEELPPKALVKLGAAFAAGIDSGLKSRDFLDADSVATTFATPRRLAVIDHRTCAPPRPTNRSAKKCCRSRSRSTPTATRPRRWPRSWPRWAAPTSPSRSSNAPPTARPRAFSTPTPRKAARWPPACRPRSTKRWPSCRFQS